MSKNDDQNSKRFPESTIVTHGSAPQKGNRPLRARKIAKSINSDVELVLISDVLEDRTSKRKRPYKLNNINLIEYEKLSNTFSDSIDGDDDTESSPTIRGGARPRGGEKGAREIGAQSRVSGRNYFHSQQGRVAERLSICSCPQVDEAACSCRKDIDDLKRKAQVLEDTIDAIASYAARSKAKTIVLVGATVLAALITACVVAQILLAPSQEGLGQGLRSISEILLGVLATALIGLIGFTILKFESLVNKEKNKIKN